MDEILTIVGLQDCSFTGTDGSLVTGLNVHCEYTSGRINGYGVQRVFLTKQKLNGLQLQVGDAIRVVYNRFGKVAGVCICE